MTALQLLLILVCMGMESLFSGLETGVISIHRMRLLHAVKKGRHPARILTGYLENTDRLLGTTLLGTNICVVITSTTAASLSLRYFGPGGEAATSFVVAVVLLTFCEYLPKAWFHSRPIDRCSPFAGFLLAAEKVLHPLSVAVLSLTRLFLPEQSSAYSKSDPFVTRDELKTMVREGALAGVLTQREGTMIRRVFELAGIRAAQIMVPRERMVVADAAMPIDRFVDLARTSGFTRFPVYDSGRKVFTGVLNVYHVLSSGATEGVLSVGALARPAYFLDENVPADEILPRLRRAHQPMCLVKSAHGDAVVGLLTTEDVLEQVVGKL
jgi:CBS domain containing-hemolysin-like protein